MKSSMNHHEGSGEKWQENLVSYEWPRKEHNVQRSVMVRVRELENVKRMSTKKIVPQVKRPT